MNTSATSVIARLLCGVLLVGGAACSQHKRETVHTVQDLLDDRVMLDGILMKCNQTPITASIQECDSARIAATRVSAQHDAAQESKRSEDFQRRRDELREQQDKQRDAAAASKKVDAYHLPVVPVDPAPAAKDPRSPMIGQTAPARD